MSYIKEKFIIFSILFFMIYSNCDANRVLNVEQINLSPQLTKEIIASQFKTNLHRRDGSEVIVYLYAENEVKSQIDDYPCYKEGRCTEKKTGAFYIYLYDVTTEAFLPYRTRIFSDVDKVDFNVEGADLIVLPGIKNVKSDVFIVSQFGGSYVNFYEAYGFSKKGLYLENYKFVVKGKREFERFAGLVSFEAKDSKLQATIVHNETDNNYVLRMDLYLSEKDGKLHFSPELI